MLRRLLPVFFQDPVWTKVMTLGSILFFILLGDAILSFWVPNFLQDSLKSPAIMGLVMSFSSIIGFGADIILPQMMRQITVKKLIVLGIAMSLLFSSLLLSTTWSPLLLIFLVAMAAWGLYYEFLGFAQQQFVADSTPLRMHSAAWAIISVFRSLAYFLGPLLAGALLLWGPRVPLAIAMLLVILGAVILLFSGKRHERQVEFEIDKVNFLGELEHWLVLSAHVWPVIILSLFLGLIDATFWTSGAVLTEKLSQENFWGSLFLPAYMFPSLFVGFIVAKLGIYTGKKKLAEKSLLLSCLFLIGLGLSENIFLQLILVLFSSILLCFSGPLTEAVYSDIIARMGRQRSHLIGLSSSTFSLAYIIGPTLAGFVTSAVGERQTFMWLGVLGVLISIVLLGVTPRKLRLPQQEIQNWD